MCHFLSVLKNDRYSSIGPGYCLKELGDAWIPKVANDGCDGPLQHIESDQPLSGTASDHSYSTRECVSTLIPKGSDHRKKDIGQDQGRHSEGCIALAQRLRSPAANCRDSGHHSRMGRQHRAQQPVLSDHIDIESRKKFLCMVGEIGRREMIYHFV
jgi:hypothetical protein